MISPACHWLLCLLWMQLGAVPAARAVDAGESAQPRPRVGLVLSGGGARGAAHVGVIRALEEMRVPIDAIAGTSMGAVVGGLYSAGLSGAEIEQVFENLDWQDMFRDRALRRDLVYRRKQDDRGIYARGTLGLRYGEGIELPLGLVQGQKITQALRNATLGVADISEFDDLPTPFRALATDLETGEAVVLDRGDLATVLRASMSAPGVLAPVEVGERLLVDGGLVDNLPVDLARSMGVDVLVVVDVSFPLAERANLKSPLDVTNQMLGIMVRRGTQASRSRLAPGDVLIEPDLGPMTALDFGRVPEVMAIGRDVPVEVRTRLAALTLRPDQYAAYRAQRVSGATEQPVVAFVRPGADSTGDAARIEAVFGDLAGAPFDAQDVQGRANRQYGLNRYQSVDYKLVREGELRGLEIDLRKKSWGPSFLRLGLGIESDHDGGSRANAAGELLMTGLNRLDGESLTELQLGDDPRFFTEWFQPLSLTNDVFLAPALRHELRSFDLVQDGTTLARYRVRESVASLAVGAELSDRGQVRLGLRRGDGSSRVQVGDPALVDGEFDIGGAYLELGYDSLDSAYFPSRGQSVRLQWQADRETLGSTIDADLLEAAWEGAWNRGRYSLLLGLEGGSALDDEFNSPQDQYTLGGFLELSGLPRDALVGTQYGLARAIVFRRVSRGGTGLFEFPAYLGFSLEAGNAWQTRDEVELDDLETAGSFFFAAESPLGPVYLAAGFAEEGERAFYLLLGRTF